MYVCFWGRRGGVAVCIHKPGSEVSLHWIGTERERVKLGESLYEIEEEVGREGRGNNTRDRDSKQMGAVVQRERYRPRDAMFRISL